MDFVASVQVGNHLKENEVILLQTFMEEPPGDEL